MRKTFKKTKFKSSNGITLIALVITIIVLLILAGVAISMLAGESGIINKTNSAKNDTAISSEEELVKLAIMSALTKGNGEIVSEVSLEELRNELTKAGCTNADDIKELPNIAKMEKSVYKIDKYGNLIEPTEFEKMPEISFGVVATEKSKYVDEKGEVVIIPKGFKILSSSAELVQDGIVVIAPDGSEFVWVPVKNINSMVMCQSHNGLSDCNIVKGDDRKLKCENHSTEPKPICGKLYATTSGNVFDESLNTQTYGAELTEPKVVTYSDFVTDDKTKGIALLNGIIGLSGTDEEIQNKWQTQLQEEYENMAISVYDNKGFYIGRYESSIKTLEDGKKVAQSIGNVVSASAAEASANTWYGLYQSERDYSTKNNLNGIVGSTMIWGSQYDQMMSWMLSKGYNIKSTNSDELDGAKAARYTGKTGVDKNTDVLNNVHDLLGGKAEYTIEAIGSYNRVNRGGSYLSSNSPSYRDYKLPSELNASVTSRIAIYVE